MSQYSHEYGGRPVPGVPCHECGSTIVYNGNYSSCDWVNPAVMLGRFTVADADFAERLILALTGKDELADPGLRDYAIDAKPRKRGAAPTGDRSSTSSTSRSTPA